MKLTPITNWWIAGLFLLAILGLLGWQIWTLRKQPRALLWPWIRRIILILLLLLMILGPSFPVSVSSPGVRNLDVLFVVDTTASMGALDYKGKLQRIIGLRDDMNKIGQALQGAHFGITTFDSKTSPTLPFTADYSTFAGTVKILERELYNTSKGTSIDEPIKIVTKQLKDRQLLYPDRSQLLFYLSDGEQTSEASVKDFSSLAKLVDGGAVLGYGSDKGAQMLKYSGLGSPTSPGRDTDYIKTIDPSSKKVVNAVSRIDEPNLKKIAKQLKLPYQNRNKGGTVAGLMDISKANLLIKHGKQVTLYANFYWAVALPFTALLFWEWRTILLDLLITKPEQPKKKRVSRQKTEGNP